MHGTSQLLVCHTSVLKTLCKFWTETAWLPQTYISIEEKKNLMLLKYENARSKLTAWVKEKKITEIGVKYLQEIMHHQWWP